VGPGGGGVGYSCGHKTRQAWREEKRLLYFLIPYTVGI
jgi:hypothetical protein